MAANIGSDTPFTCRSTSWPSTSANMREVHDPGLRELAESMGPARIGQLQPILVVWRDGRFQVAARFRRALAMTAHRLELGFTGILARRVPIEDADVARLVGNLSGRIHRVRDLPLPVRVEGGAEGRGDQRGASGGGHRQERPAHRQPDPILPRAPGRPANAWAADRHQRFTFAVLRELPVAPQSGDDAAVRAIVERTFKVSSPPNAVGGSPRPGVIRRLGNASTTKLQRRLEAGGIDRLHSDDRAELV